MRKRHLLQLHDSACSTDLDAAHVCCARCASAQCFLLSPSVYLCPDAAPKSLAGLLSSDKLLRVTSAIPGSYAIDAAANTATQAWMFANGIIVTKSGSKYVGSDTKEYVAAEVCAALVLTRPRCCEPRAVVVSCCLVLRVFSIIKGIALNVGVLVTLQGFWEAVRVQHRLSTPCSIIASACPCLP
jgi:hypothetical protein